MQGQTDRPWTGRTAIVAGNGASLARIRPGILLADDLIVRTNNFFLEPRYFLGQKVDLAVMGGDPRVAPFMFETLYRCRADYELKGWVSVNPKVQAVGQRRFSDLSMPFPWRDQALETAVANLTARYGKKLMTGTYGLLAAYGLGASKILLCGFDLYKDGQHYAFPLGKHQSDLMGHVMRRSGIDDSQHDRNLDSAVIGLLQDRGDVALFRTSDETPWDNLLPMAADRIGTPLAPSERAGGPRDWVSHVGPYPIQLLKLLRWGSRVMRGAGGSNGR